MDFFLVNVRHRGTTYDNLVFRAETAKDAALRASERGRLGVRREEYWVKNISNIVEVGYTVDTKATKIKD